MEYLILCIGIILSCTVCTADYCLTYYSPGSQTFYYSYCSAGCCGSSNDLFCCSETPVGTIVGAVLGCLLGIGIICAVVACCMFAAKGRARKEQLAREQELGRDNTVVAYHGALPGDVDLPRFNDPPPPGYHPAPAPLAGIGGATGGMAPVEGAGGVSLDALPPKT